MRDPDRIDLVIEELREVWKQNPDMRLTQLIQNVVIYGSKGLYGASWATHTPPAFYNTEEETILLGLEKMKK